MKLESALTGNAKLGVYAVAIGEGTWVAKGTGGASGYTATADDATHISSDRPSDCGVVFDESNYVIELSTDAREGGYIYVSNTQGDTSAAIGSKNNPYTSLAEAYENAKPNDTIVLLANIVLSDTLDLNGNTNLGDSSVITITSDGEDAKKITRSGTQTVLSVSKGIINLENVTLGGDDAAAANSPAVAVSGGTLTLGTGSSVQGFETNLASTSTVLVSGGALVIDGGSITENSATDAGAIKQTGGTVTLNSGSITGNVSESTAGGIYFVKGKLFLNGGTVENNTSEGSTGDGCAGGIYISNGESSTRTVAIGGGDTALKINGNTDANGDSNLKVVTGGVVQRIPKTTLADGSAIGLSLTTWPSSGSQWVLSQVSESEAEFFSSDKPSLAGTVRDSDDGKLSLSFDERTATAVYVSETGSDTTGDGTKEHPFATVDHAYDIVQDNGTIYLLSDISQDASVAVDENKTVTIASDGENDYSLKRTGASGETMFAVSDGTLKLTNVTLDGGNHQTSASNAVLMSGGTVEIAEGATIKQFCTTDATGSVGGAVTVNGGTLKMTGGTIQDNSGQNGGGVLLNGGTLNMTGGEIKDNYASGSGGGICVASGTAEISGGKVTGNCSAEGAGVCLSGSSSAVTMTGGEVSGNGCTSSDAGKAAGIQKDAGALTIGGTAVVKDNKSGSTWSSENNEMTLGTTDSNLCVKSGETLKISADSPLADGAEIHISTESTPTESGVQFATNADDGDQAYFQSDAPKTAGVLYKDNGLYLSTAVAEGKIDLGTAPTGISVSGGSLQQTGLTGAMENVVLTAGDGYADLTQAQADAINEKIKGAGLKAELVGRTIVISGTPTIGLSVNLSSILSGDLAPVTAQAITKDANGDVLGKYATVSEALTASAAEGSSVATILATGTGLTAVDDGTLPSGVCLTTAAGSFTATGGAATIDMDSSGNVTLKGGSLAVEKTGEKSVADVNVSYTDQSGTTTAYSVSGGSYTVSAGTDGSMALTVGSDEKAVVDTGASYSGGSFKLCKTTVEGTTSTTVTGTPDSSGAYSGTVTSKDGNDSISIVGSDTKILVDANGAIKLVGGEGSSEGNMTATMFASEDSGTDMSFSGTKKYTVDTANGKLRTDAAGSVTSGGITFTGAAGSEFSLAEGSDSGVAYTATVPSGAKIAESGGPTIEGVAKGTEAGANDTQVQVGTDGHLILIAGKGKVAGEATVKVKAGDETVEVKVPSGETYTIDADAGTVNGLSQGKTVTIGGVIYQAGEGTTSFPIKSGSSGILANTGDKATVPGSTASDVTISLGSDDDAEKVTVSGSNTGDVSVEKTSSGYVAEVTVGAEDGPFVYGGNTYKAGSSGAVFKIDDDGSVYISSGSAVIGDGMSIYGKSGKEISNPAGTSGDSITVTADSPSSGKDTVLVPTSGGKVKIGGTEYETTADNTKIEVSSETDAPDKVVQGAVKLDNGEKVSVGNGNVPVENLVEGDGKQITVTAVDDGKGSVTIPVGGKAKINGTTEIECPTGSSQLTVGIDADGKSSITLGEGQSVTIDGRTYSGNGCVITIGTDGAVSFTGTISTTIPVGELKAGFKYEISAGESVILGDYVYTAPAGIEKGAVTLEFEEGRSNPVVTLKEATGHVDVALSNDPTNTTTYTAVNADTKFAMTYSGDDKDRTKADLISNGSTSGADSELKVESGVTVFDGERSIKAESNDTQIELLNGNATLVAGKGSSTGKMDAVLKGDSSSTTFDGNGFEYAVSISDNDSSIGTLELKSGDSSTPASVEMGEVTFTGKASDSFVLGKASDATDAKTTATIPADATITGIDSAGSVVTIVGVTAADGEDATKVEFDSNGVLTLVAGKGTSSGKMDVRLSGDSASTSFSGVENAKYTVDTKNKTLVLGSGTADFQASVKMGNVTFAGKADDSFALGKTDDGETTATIPANASITGIDSAGKTVSIKGVAAVEGGSATKVEFGSDGVLVLVAGKGEVTGEATVKARTTVDGQSKDVELKIPAGKTYTIDLTSSPGYVIGGAASESVTIDGVECTSGSGNWSFPLDISNGKVTNNGDKAVVPGGTSATIAFGSSDTEKVIIPGKTAEGQQGTNVGKVTVEKTESGAKVTVASEGDTFAVGDRTYTAPCADAVFMIDSGGNVTAVFPESFWSTKGSSYELSPGESAVIGKYTYTAPSSGNKGDVTITSRGSGLNPAVALKNENGTVDVVLNSDSTKKTTYTAVNAGTTFAMSAADEDTKKIDLLENGTAGSTSELKVESGATVSGGERSIKAESDNTQIELLNGKATLVAGKGSSTGKMDAVLKRDSSSTSFNGNGSEYAVSISDDDSSIGTLELKGGTSGAQASVTMSEVTFTGKANDSFVLGNADDGKTTATIPADASITGKDSAGSVVTIVGVTAAEGEDATEVEFDSDGVLVLVAGKGISSGKMDARLSGDSASTSFSGVENAKYTVDTKNKTLVLGSGTSEAQVSVEMGKVTFTGKASDSFALGKTDDGKTTATIPADATITGIDSNGKTVSIKGVDATGEGNATKVGFDSDGVLVLVAGKGQVTGEATVKARTTVGGTTKDVEVKVPANKTYTIDLTSSPGYVIGNAESESVTIDGVECTSGSGNWSFPLDISNEEVANVGDKAVVPGRTSATIAFGSSDTEKVIIPGKTAEGQQGTNVGKVTVQKAAAGCTVTVEEAGDTFIINGVTYTAFCDGAIYTVDSSGNVTAVIPESAWKDPSFSYSLKAGESITVGKYTYTAPSGEGAGNGDVVLKARASGGNALNPAVVLSKAGGTVDVALTDTPETKTTYTAVNAGTTFAMSATDDDTKNIDLLEDGTAGSTSRVKDVNGATVSGGGNSVTAASADAQIELLNGKATLVSGKGSSTGSMAAAVGSGTEDFATSNSTAYTVDISAGTLTLDAAGTGSKASVKMGNATFTGKASDSFVLGKTDDGKATATIPADATITGKDGATIKGIAKEGDSGEDTKVEIGSDGSLTLVKGKGVVTGPAAAKVRVTVGETTKIVELGVPAGKTYTINTVETVPVLSVGDVLTIDGTEYEAASDSTAIDISVEPFKLTSGAVKLDKGEGIGVGNSNTPVVCTGDTSIIVRAANDGSGSLEIVQGGAATINGIPFEGLSGDVTYTIGSDGKVDVTLQKGQSVKINGRTYVGTDDGVQLEIDKDGNVTNLSKEDAKLEVEEGLDQVIDSGDHAVGEVITLPEKDADDQPIVNGNGQILVGWEISSGGSTTEYGLGSDYVVEADASVGGKWMDADKVVVYATEDGGVIQGKPYDELQSDVVELRSADGITARDDGCVFVGWTPRDGVNQGVVYAPGTRLDSSPTDTYMNAYFIKEEDACKLTYYDESDSNGTIGCQWVEANKNKVVWLPTALDMVRDGYKFVGWGKVVENSNSEVDVRTLGAEPASRMTLITESYYEVNEDETLYAIWEEEPSDIPWWDDEDDCPVPIVPETEDTGKYDGKVLILFIAAIAVAITEITVIVTHKKR